MILCGKCRGLGRVRLGRAMLAVYRLFSGRRALTARQVISRLDQAVKHCAADNRLAHLHRLGLLARRRDGREWKYHLP